MRYEDMCEILVNETDFNKKLKEEIEELKNLKKIQSHDIEIFCLL